MTTAAHSGVVLGVGTPNLCSSGAKTMCAIVLTESGLIRIYPIPGEASFPVWSNVNLALTRTNSDSRDESWKLEDYQITGKVADPTHKRTILNRCVLQSAATDPIDFQNRLNKSICVVQPRSLGAAIEPREARSDEDWVHTQDMAWTKPYLTWRSTQGGEHKSHIVSREAYETIRRNPHSPWDLFRNMNLCSPDWDFWIVLGNMKNRRNVWCAVHVHRLKKTSGLSTRPCFGLIDGKPDDWPYSTQLGGNVPVAEGQLEMFITAGM